MHLDVIVDDLDAAEAGGKRAHAAGDVEPDTAGRDNAAAGDIGRGVADPSAIAVTLRVASWHSG